MIKIAFVKFGGMGVYQDSLC